MGRRMGRRRVLEQIISIPLMTEFWTILMNSIVMYGVDGVTRTKVDKAYALLSSIFVPCAYSSKIPAEPRQGLPMFDLVIG